ncbi:MAG: PHP domain-containing protein [Clostridia bacterium]|nr:PHP domain-containing protein [Clostridia bacterium]
MEKLIDLHTHSNKSDGSYSPSELVMYAKKHSLSAIALTDHDTVDGVKEAVLAGKKENIEVVSGIELSAKSKTETHILGYFIDISNENLQKELAGIKKVRLERNKEVEHNLQKMGFEVSLAEAERLSGGGIVGRAHFARVMMDKGYVKSVKDAFDKYLSSGKGGYSSNQKITPEQAVEIIKNAGGKAFAAHLHLMKRTDDDLFDFLKSLKEAGLDGIEGFYTDYTFDMQKKYLDMAKRLDLLISGGTDFHGAMKPHIEIGTGYGNLKIPYSLLDNMRG